MTTKSTKLVALLDGRALAIGDTVKDFRGEPRIFRGITRASAPGQTGKIMLGGREVYEHTVPGLTIEAR